MAFSLKINSMLEKLLPERKEVEETDEMDKVELVDFEPNQERRPSQQNRESRNKFMQSSHHGTVANESD